MTLFRNWIEESLQKRIQYVTRCLGSRGGRKYYEVTLEDGSSKDYFIDFDKKLIEEVR